MITDALGLPIQPTEKSLETAVEGCMEPLHGFMKTDWSNAEGRAGYTEVFMSRLFDLYVITQRNPALKETIEYQDFLQTSAPLVVKISDCIIDFDINIQNLFNIDPTYWPWSEVCWRRSAFEAFKEMYQFIQETELSEYIDLSHEDFDSEYTDEMIEGYALRDGAGTIYGSGVPAGIPRSHWWWWGEKIRAEVPSAIWS